MTTPGDLGGYDPQFVARTAPRLARYIHRWFRARVQGFDHLPTGPFVAVGNHSGAVMIPDVLVWLSAYHARAEGPPLLTLAHDAMFRSYPRPLATMAARFGAIRADRVLAAKALAEGYAVQVYPGGDEDACRSFRRRHDIVFAGRRGYVKLAAAAGVPIVPVVSCGAHEACFIHHDGLAFARRSAFCRRHRLTAFPVSTSFPWLLWFGPPPGYLPLPTKIDIRVLPAIDPPKRDVDDSAIEATDLRVRRKLQTKLSEMAARRRFPILG